MAPLKLPKDNRLNSLVEGYIIKGKQYGFSRQIDFPMEYISVGYFDDDKEPRSEGFYKWFHYD